MIRALALSAALLSTVALSAEPKVHTVKIEGMKFVPEKLTVKKGEVVVWQNADLVPHTVMGGPIMSPVINAGATFRWTADKAGAHDYMCTLHPNMRGAVTVK
jgi:plastocyanin